MLTYDEGKNFLQEKPEAAMSHFLGIAERELENPIAQFWMGVCYLRSKQFTRAEKQFRKAVSLGVGHPQTAHFHYYLGLSLERQQRQPEADAAYRATLALAPKYRLAADKLGLPLESTPRPAPEPATPRATAQNPSPAVKPADASDSSSLAADLASGKEVGPGEKLFSKRRAKRTFYGHIFVLIALLISMAFLWFVDSTGAVELALALCIPPGLAFVSLLLRSRYWRVTFFERRIDLEKGVFNRSTRSVWLYEITDLGFSRRPLDLLASTGRIKISTKKRPFLLVGIGNGRFTKDLWAELRDSVLVERRAMKQVWID